MIPPGSEWFCMHIGVDTINVKSEMYEVLVVKSFI